MAKRQPKPVLPTARTVKLYLDGQQYIVEFNFRAYAAFLELTGISLLKGWNASTIDAKEIACLLYAGLLTHHRDIEIDFCFDTLRIDNFDAVYSKLIEAYKLSLPKPKEDSNPPMPVDKQS
jgi:hypothetical protein